MRAIGLQFSRRLFCSAQGTGPPKIDSTGPISALFSKGELDEIFKPELTKSIKE